MRPLRYSIYCRHVEELTTNISNIAKHSGCNNLGLTSILLVEKCISVLALLYLQQSKMRKQKLYLKYQTEQQNTCIQLAQGYLWRSVWPSV